MRTTSPARGRVGFLGLSSNMYDFAARWVSTGPESLRGPGKRGPGRRSVVGELVRIRAGRAGPLPPSKPVFPLFVEGRPHLETPKRAA